MHRRILREQKAGEPAALESYIVRNAAAGKIELPFYKGSHQLHTMFVNGYLIIPAEQQEAEERRAHAQHVVGLLGRIWHLITQLGYLASLASLQQAHFARQQG